MFLDTTNIFTVLSVDDMDVADKLRSGSCTQDKPFAFGKNWARFLATLNEDRIRAAESSLRNLLRRDGLSGSTFLDAGSGSGLFSLAAYRLGAEVTSFDVDADAVVCTEKMKRRYGNEDKRWRVVSGSLRDQSFLESLGEFDFVYCWGVAHHTGDMWTAIKNLVPLVKKGGSLVLAIYNDQLYISRAWRGVKQLHQRLPVLLRPSYIGVIGIAAFMKRLAVTVMACLLRMLTLRNPFVPLTNWATETQSRGMHGWYDLVDWVGGWPFEVARPEEVFRFLRDHGFVLQELTTSVGHGCNEFTFARIGNSVG